MVMNYIDWFFTFVADMIGWMNAQFIVPGVSLLGFIMAVALLCIVIGGFVIR